MKTIIRGIVIGVFVGLVISIIHSYLFGGGYYYPMSPNSGSGNFLYQHVSETTVFIIALLCWSLIGTMFTVSSKIFQKENWSVLKMTTAHFSIVIIFFLPLSMLSGWYPFKLQSILMFIVIFLIIYAFIWCLMFFISFIRIKKINRKLKDL